MNDHFENIKSIKDLKEIFINFIPIFRKKKNKLNLFSMCFYRLNVKDKKQIFDKYVEVNNDRYSMKILFKRGLIKIKIKKYIYYFNIFKVSFDLDKIKNYPPQNLLKVLFTSKNENIEMPMVYNLIHFKNYKGYTSKVYKIDNSKLVCYFRQAKLNSIGITVRQPNQTDELLNKIKIFIAKVLSIITIPKNNILLYEKEANKYEESASIVYEKLIDMGYKNCYYLINKNSDHISFIKNKYKKNIIYAHTLKHYYYFFKCKKFIGTETVPHSIELRIANKYVTQKIIKKKYQQVFLQHGVMYMVALDSIARGGFRKNGNEMSNDAKIVVSSKLEADHFVNLGGFNYSDLYITGLPAYDKSIKNANADKIVVMLTWRSWDYNMLLSDYKKASYYKFVKRILKSIPKEYQDKVYFLPHPLILNKFINTDLNFLIPKIDSYDKVLEKTALLITDYSSISYSAFYRGANIIFCWDELDQCMEQYKSHLMLNETNTFGDVTYNCHNLGQLIKDNYLKKQKTKYKNNYKKIVEFDDNKNTDRLIDCLKKDKII